MCWAHLQGEDGHHALRPDAEEPRQEYGCAPAGTTGASSHREQAAYPEPQQKLNLLLQLHTWPPGSWDGSPAVLLQLERSSSRVPGDLSLRPGLPGCRMANFEGAQSSRIWFCSCTPELQYAADALASMTTSHLQHDGCLEEGLLVRMEQNWLPPEQCHRGLLRGPAADTKICRTPSGDAPLRIQAGEVGHEGLGLI